MYIIDKESKKPLHLQLYEAIKEEIVHERKPGDKLPSIRKVATLYNLSKTTVENAYSQLYAEGYIESRPKSGYYVSDFDFGTFSPPSKTTPPVPNTPAYRYDFFPAQLDKESFPLKIWKRIYTQVITQELDFGSYHDGAGEIGLRQEIAKYLTTSRGVSCDASQIIITAGFSDAMGLLAKLVKKRYDTFGMEEPGYHVARRVFEEYGYTIEKIPVLKDGVSLKAVERSKAQILYITPSHQYPTGVTIPIARRLKLLSTMHARGGLIIEDDYDSELRYYHRPIPSLQGLDQYDCVVYMGTFAKSLSPALRIAYMVLPRHLLPLFEQSYDVHFPRVSLTTQKTMEYFMKKGHWERHLRKIRTQNKKKHHLLKHALQKHLKESFTILAEGGGLAILIHPTRPFDWEKFQLEAEKEKIKIYLAKERSGGAFEAVRMGFGGFKEEEINKAVEAFSKVWFRAFLE